MIKYLPALLLLFTSYSFSQITVTSSDFAGADDTVRMSLATDPTIDIVSTGANQNWDYSYLSVTDQNLVEYTGMSGVPVLVNLSYGPFAPVKYQASYYLPATNLPINQLSNFLPITIEDPRSYYRLTSDSMSVVGYTLTIQGNEAPFKADTIEKYYQFPLNYGDTYTGRGVTNVDFNPIYNGAWIQKRSRTSEVDGWGSITTPYGTFNAIRIKHTIEEQDSVLVDFMGTSSWFELPVPMNYVYEWWTNGEKDAILRVNTRDVAGSEVVSGIEFRDNYKSLAAVESLDQNKGIVLYPVPASDQLFVDGIKDFTSYSIFDENGGLIKTGVYQGGIDISDLLVSTYMIILKSDNGIQSQTFIKK